MFYNLGFEMWHRPKLITAVINACSLNYIRLNNLPFSIHSKETEGSSVCAHTFLLLIIHQFFAGAFHWFTGRFWTTAPFCLNQWLLRLQYTPTVNGVKSWSVASCWSPRGGLNICRWYSIRGIFSSPGFIITLLNHCFLPWICFLSIAGWAPHCIT